MAGLLLALVKALAKALVKVLVTVDGVGPAAARTRDSWPAWVLVAS